MNFVKTKFISKRFQENINGDKIIHAKERNL